MKLKTLDKQRNNIFHHLYSFKNDYEGMPLHHTRLIGQSDKKDPLNLICLQIETLTIFQLNNQNYSLETILPLNLMAIAEAESQIDINYAYKIINEEVFDTTICLQRVLLQKMLEEDLMSEEQLEAYNQWNAVLPSELLKELDTDSDSFNPIHVSHFVANCIYRELANHLRSCIK